LEGGATRWSEGGGAGSHGKTEKLKDGNTEKLKRRLEDAVTGRGLLVARGGKDEETKGQPSPRDGLPSNQLTKDQETKRGGVKKLAVVSFQ
jgi:hypothetical protein